MEEKCEKMPKSNISRQKPVGCIGTAQIGTGTDWQWITGTTTSSSPIFAYFAPLSPVFIRRMFKDPKK